MDILSHFIQLIVIFGHFLDFFISFLADAKYNCTSTMSKPAQKLKLRLISGHHLPKIDGKIKGNVIQPYVRIKIRGHAVDESEFTSDVVPKVFVVAAAAEAIVCTSKCCALLLLQNGFNPIWDTTTEFSLVYPEMTFIELQVRTRKDDSKSYDDPVIGTSILPFSLLRQGYRHAYLEDVAGHRLTPACLFLNVVVIDCSSNKT